MASMVSRAAGLRAIWNYAIWNYWQFRIRDAQFEILRFAIMKTDRTRDRGLAPTRERWRVWNLRIHRLLRDLDSIDSVRYYWLFPQMFRKRQDCEPGYYRDAPNDLRCISCGLSVSLSLSLSLYIYICVYVYVYTYIYIYIEREIVIYIYIYMYIYIYTYTHMYVYV